MVVAETRRRWTQAEKRVILVEAEGQSVSAVARKHGVAAGLVFRWRKAGRKAADQRTSAFVPVALLAPSTATAPLASAPSLSCGVIEIELCGGRRIRLSGPVEAGTLKQVIAVLEGR